jgi:LPS-assembly protein
MSRSSGRWRPKWHGLGATQLFDAAIVAWLKVWPASNTTRAAGRCAASCIVWRRPKPSVTSAFFVQLELHGLTKLGPNPLDILKRSITGYVQSSEIL